MTKFELVCSPRYNIQLLSMTPRRAEHPAAVQPGDQHKLDDSASRLATAYKSQAKLTCADHHDRYISPCLIPSMATTCAQTMASDKHPAILSLRTAALLTSAAGLISLSWSLKHQEDISDDGTGESTLSCWEPYVPAPIPLMSSSNKT